MKSFYFSGCAIALSAGAAMLAGCGGSQPIGTTGTLPQTSALTAHALYAAGLKRGRPQAILGTAVGGVRPAQSCPGRYAECIALAYGSPFEQEWCVSLHGYAVNSDCASVPRSDVNESISYGPWYWSAKIKGIKDRHQSVKDIGVSINPNPGNPTGVTISERQRIRSSRGKIVDVLWLNALFQFSQGWGGPGNVLIGISTE